MPKNKMLVPEIQEKKEFSLSTAIHGKKIKVDSLAPYLSSNGGLLLLNRHSCDFIDQIARCIPENRNLYLIQHTLSEMSYPDIPQKSIDMSFEYLF